MSNVATTTEKYLYKIDTKGLVRSLKIFVDGGDLCSEAGLLDGAKVPQRKTCKGKNIGKSNETSPEQQALSEMWSKVAEKKNEGYFDTIEEAKTTTVISPMLAAEYDKVTVDYSNPVFAQPKLDGMRCLAIVSDGKVTLMSRGGKRIETLDHIVSAIESVCTEMSNFILDGEAYAHGITFQQNMELVKKVRPGTETVRYHIYDIITNEAYSIRKVAIEGFVKATNNPLIILVDSVDIGGKGMLDDCHAKNLSDGFEGTIIRQGLLGYEMDKRSKSLVKYKDFKDMDAEIVDIEPSDARPDQGVVVCKYMGQLFKANPKMSHQERRDLLINKTDYIGKTANIRYFELTDGGLPRFPVFIGIHADR